MKKKLRLGAFILLCPIFITGCKHKQEIVTIGSKYVGGNNQGYVYIDKRYTFKDYTVEESEDEVIVTIRFKPYVEEE